MEQNKMLKNVKISNNKLNITTLAVILIYLAYFTTCFGISLQYLSEIKTQISMNTQLYSMAPTLQYSYLYFMNDLLSDNSTTPPSDLGRGEGSSESSKSQGGHRRTLGSEPSKPQGST